MEYIRTGTSPHQSSAFGKSTLRGRTGGNMEQSQLDGNDMVGMEEKLPNGDVFALRSVGTNEKTAGLQTSGSLSCGDSNGTGRRGESSVSNAHNLESSSAGCSTPLSSERNGEVMAAWRTRQETIRGRANVPRVLLESITSIIRQICLEWDDFFHSRTDSRVGGMIRIAYSLVALFNTGHLMMDFDLFFVHLIPTSTGQDSWANPNIHTVFTLLPEEEQESRLRWGAMIWLAQLVFLLLGVAPRFNAICNFFWHCMFQHHNDLLFTGADCVIRLLAFFMIFLPLHRHTVWEFFGVRKQPSETSLDTWPMVSLKESGDFVNVVDIISSHT
jgi:hypothetical protein